MITLVKPDTILHDTAKTYYIPVGNRKYPLIITDTTEVDEVDGPVVIVRCDAIGMHQDYLRDDLPILFADIGDMIASEIAENKDEDIHIRIRSNEKQKISENANKYGFSSVSKYARAVMLNPTLVSR